MIKPAVINTAPVPYSSCGPYSYRRVLHQSGSLYGCRRGQRRMGRPLVSIGVTVSEERVPREIQRTACFVCVRVCPASSKVGKSECRGCGFRLKTHSSVRKQNAYFAAYFCERRCSPRPYVRVFWFGPMLGGALGTVVWEAILRPDPVIEDPDVKSMPLDVTDSI